MGTNVLIRSRVLYVCVLLFVPASAMDGQVTGMGFFDFDPYDDNNMLYTDRGMLPETLTGMSHEMKTLVQGLSNYIERNPVDSEAQEEEEARRLQEQEERKVPDQKIPRKIWQRCESTPLPRVLKAYAHTWSELNPEYTHTVLDDKAAADFVSQHYPALVAAYCRLRHRQASEELLSYLLLYKYGGVYASIDCTCERPLSRLIAPDDDMLVGLQPQLESKVLRKRAGLDHHNLPLQQWCMASAPGHPVIHYMIDYFIKNVDR
jgi:mannosyltransferase OCH1-like enzyme